MSVLASVGFSTPRTLLGWVLFVGLLVFAWWRIARVRRRARDYRDAQTGDATASFSRPGSPGWYPERERPDIGAVLRRPELDFEHQTPRIASTNTVIA